MEYRFKFEVFEVESGEVVVGGSTYLSDINEFGECESVDMEVSSALRAFKNTLKRKFEEEHEEDNLCGKPHNNGEESCMECDVIRAGV